MLAATAFLVEVPRLCPKSIKASITPYAVAQRGPSSGSCAVTTCFSMRIGRVFISTALKRSQNNSPLASGFLTGKLTSGEDVEGTRFDRTNTAGAFHQSWYDKPGMHWAINKLQVVIKPHKLTLAGVSLRWLMYHSMLGEGDGIILGGSKFDQIASNVADIAKGLLEKVVVKALNEMWLSVKIKAP